MASTTSETPSNQTNDEKKSTNEQVVEELERLSKALAKLDTSSKRLSHYRDPLPTELSAAFGMLREGSEWIHATSTKYTLVSKIDVKESTKLATDLQRGCQWLGLAAEQVLGGKLACRALQTAVKRSVCSVVGRCQALVQAFVVEPDLDPAVLTGAIWDACQGLEHLPPNNRAAMGRELLSWLTECQETMTEFQTLVDLGARNEDEEEPKEEEVDDDDDLWDEERQVQYTEAELELVKTCLYLLKGSRGAMNVALKALETAGKQHEAQKEEATETTTTGMQDSAAPRDLLQWMGEFYENVRVVGDGVTDLGVLLYPPLEAPRLAPQIHQQTAAVLTVVQTVLDGTIRQLPESVQQLAQRVETAIQTRRTQAEQALERIT